MPVKVLEWKLAPGNDLPEPVVEDDRASFPENVVRDVLNWLTTSQLQMQAKATQPEPIIIALGEPGKDGSIKFDTLATKVQAVTFTHGRIELHMRDRHTKIVLATFVYLCALSSDGRHIVGPKLVAKQKAQIQ